MPSTYTSRLRLELQATGENRTTWGINANQVFSRIEEAIAGMSTVAMGDANVTLTTANGTSDQARNMAIYLTGANTAIRTVTVPSVTKFYVIGNATTGGFAVNVKTAAGASVSVGSGKWALLFCDGTNFARSWDNGVFADNVSGAVAVANGGTGATDASTARTNLGVAIGTNVQAYDAGLQSISGLTTAADRMIYTTASDTYAVTTLSAFARTFLDDADAATFRATTGTDSATTLTTGTLPSGRLTGTYNISISGNAATATSATSASSASSATLATKASTLAQGGGNGAAMTFNWSGQGGQPSWLWGSNDGTNILVWNPSNFSVNNAANLGGAAASTYLQTSDIGSSVQGYNSDLQGIANADWSTPAGYESFVTKKDDGAFERQLIGNFSATLISNTTATQWRDDLGVGTSSAAIFGSVEVDEAWYKGWPNGSPDFSSSTDPGWYIAMSGLISASRSGANALQLQRTTSDGSLVSFRRNTSQVGTISVTTTATAYNTSSDIRLKQDLRPINPALLDAIKVYDFEWKSDGTRAYGVMAQELEPILPQAVDKGETPEDMWSVDYSKLVPLLIATVQEMKERIKFLEEKLNDL